MGNPLLVLWYRMFADDEAERERGLRATAVKTQHPSSGALPHTPDWLADGNLPGMPDQPSAGILLVLRRIRIPLIVLIVIFAISVLGLALVPGEDAQGRPTRMTIFEAFYFMSFTATTIGFGEIPDAFTDAQRMWVTLAIFLSVIGWAYAIGSLLGLMQDRAFRRALARRHFANKVSHMAEPFLMLVGYGNATKHLARSLDDMGRRFVVVDGDENRLAGVDLASYRADTPTLLGDARDTRELLLAGLGHRHCEGVVALTGHDETNLDVAMTSSLLRPGLPVIARASSREIAERMRAAGDPVVVNPLDRFGDHLRILLRSPSAYQLMVWLTSAPGTPLPARREPLPRGRWVVCGYGRFGRELTADLRAEGLQVTAVEAPAPHDGGGYTFDGVDLEQASAFVAATEDDMTNLWLVERARRANPGAFVVTLENRATNVSLFNAIGVDFGLQPAEVIAHEVVARLANPALMRFLPQVPRQDEAWAARMVQTLVERSGTGTPDLWLVRLSRHESEALERWMAGDGLRLGALLRSPLGRERYLDAVVLVVLRDGTAAIAPDDDFLLLRDDELLLAGGSTARRELDATLTDEPTAAYVIDGVFAPSSWIWRKYSRQGRAAPRAGM
ncbi:MAG TPA: NAD-binding protein [Nocardioidaceae bacterium]|nr:NAD-binding protein [Nocardioidaceae bacterium]